jgi:DNA-binding HxlR family transcriptional regulator
LYITLLSVTNKTQYHVRGNIDVTDSTDTVADDPTRCPMGACMRLLGGAWTPNLIWQLSGGPRRFTALHKDIAGISAKMLSARLRELEAKRVVVREVSPTSPPSVAYALTPLGRELVPVIDAMVRVGTRLVRSAPKTRAGARRAR